MAWIVDVKLTNRWSVRAFSEDVGSELWERRVAYREAHPELFRTRAAVYVQGVHLPRELFPAEAHVQTKTREPPDILNMSGYGVSERIKRLIESVEPGVHQFVEVPTYLRNGEPAPQRYYGMSLGQVAYHQIDDELTTIRRTRGNRIESPDPTYRRGHIAINRDETAGWHAWFSSDIFNCLTISDELHAFFKAEKVPGLDYTRLIERDRRGGAS